MTDTPKAIRLAGAIHCGDSACKCSRNQAATELRRLHEVNQELLEALERIAASDPTHTHFATLAISEARAAIAKATGEQT